jgi:hypothetical protein
MGKIYAFDVDETLEISGGPVRLGMLLDLKSQGHILGLCGNWAVVTRNLPWWACLFSFFNAGADKAPFLVQVKTYVPAEDYVMVGNIKDVSGASDDAGAAAAAGWRFIRESEFAGGAR